MQGKQLGKKRDTQCKKRDTLVAQNKTRQKKLIKRTMMARFRGKLQTDMINQKATAS